MEGIETPKPASDTRDLIHAKFNAFQEQLRGRKGMDFGRVRQIFAPAEPIPLPVLVVTGFLGSGKTTLVKQRLGRHIGHPKWRVWL